MRHPLVTALTILAAICCLMGMSTVQAQEQTTAPRQTAETTTAPNQTQEEQAQQPAAITQPLAMSGSLRCVIKADSSVWCWQNPQPVRKSLDKIEGLDTQPQRIPGIEATKISVADGYACAIATDQSVWCWGNGYYPGNQNGNRSSAPAHQPTRIPDLKATDVELSTFGSCVIDTEQNVRCWGDLVPNAAAEGEPIPGIKARDISADTDRYQTCAVTADAVLCWNTSFEFKQPVRKLADVGGTAVTVQKYFMCMVDNSGHPWCQGSNRDGQLGADHPGQSDKLLKVEKFTEKLTSIDSDEHSVCGTDTHNTIWCWGDPPKELAEKQDINYPEVPVAFSERKAHALAIADGTACLQGEQLWCTRFQEYDPELRRVKLPRNSGLQTVEGF